jgi:uncharacterized protein
MTWYEKGLRFQCTQCGKCCTGSPGYVWVEEKEIEAMAEFLKISTEVFMKRYVRKVGAKYSLREDPRTFDCVFLKGKKCDVYGARPKQCRTYPWWKENLSTPAAWEEASKVCEGIDQRDARLYTLEEIQKTLDS